MPEPICTDVRIVRSTIAVDMVRHTFSDGTTEWTEIDFTKIHNLGHDLTSPEQHSIIEQICESAEEAEIINALLNAVAGGYTIL